MSISEFNRALQQSPELKAYFETLPANIQENVYMTSPGIVSVEQLKSIVATMTERTG